MSLNLNFTVLLPSSDVLRHIIKLNLLFQEFVHLSLDWVFFSILNECSTKIKCRHCVEIFVRTAVASKHSEVWIKQIFSMTSVGNTIINNLLQNYFHRSFTVERQIFPVASYDLSISFKTLFYRCII